VVSHHVYTNTIHDLEMTLLYPFIHWFPTDDKPSLVRYVPYLTLIVYPFVIPGQFVIRYVYIIIVSYFFHSFSGFQYNTILLACNKRIFNSYGMIE